MGARGAEEALNYSMVASNLNLFPDVRPGSMLRFAILDRT